MMGRDIIQNKRSANEIDIIDGVRYSFRSLLFLNVVTMTRIFRIVPNILCNAETYPATMDSVSSYTKLVSCDGSREEVDLESIFIQHVSKYSDELNFTISKCETLSLDFILDTSDLLSSPYYYQNVYIT
jgi:hypothetical protein